MLRSALLALTLVATGCDTVTNLLPDGGKGRVVCYDGKTQVPVRVNKSDGTPALGATVKARNNSFDEEVQGEVNGNGVFLVLDKDLAPGTVLVTASMGTSTAGPAQIEFVCGECDCTATPNSLTLKLN